MQVAALQLAAVQVAAVLYRLIYPMALLFRLVSPNQSFAWPATKKIRLYITTCIKYKLWWLFQRKYTGWYFSYSISSYSLKLIGRTLIFVNAIVTAKRIDGLLRALGFNSRTIHGQLEVTMYHISFLYLIKFNPLFLSYQNSKNSDSEPSRLFDPLPRAY